MPWYYSQSTGQMNRDGIPLIGHAGYSGAGVGKDNPRMESVRDVGPIPAGTYQIGPAYDHPTKGPTVMKLTPQGHEARGRTGFMIHGDSRDHPGQASQGCIVLTAPQRKAIATSVDNTLEVTD